MEFGRRGLQEAVVSVDTVDAPALAEVKGRERARAVAIALYGDKLKKKEEDILDDRVRYILGLGGYAHDEIEAALAAGAADLPDLRRRVDALHRVRGEANFLTVAQAAKRIANITKGAEHGDFDSARFVEPAEKDLATAFATLRTEIDEAAAAGDYDRCLRRVIDLAPVLDRFFVEVLVMAEDEAVRRNRLEFLHAIGRSVSRTAKLSAVVADEGGQVKRCVNVVRRRLPVGLGFQV